MIPHVYRGSCPYPTAPGARDPDCPACRHLVENERRIRRVAELEAEVERLCMMLEIIDDAAEVYDPGHLRRVNAEQRARIAELEAEVERLRADPRLTVPLTGLEQVSDLLDDIIRMALAQRGLSLGAVKLLAEEIGRLRKWDAAQVAAGGSEVSK